MSKRYNGGRGARICDDCRIMVASGSSVLRTFISIDLVAYDFDADAEPFPWDFCCVACLEAAVYFMASRIARCGEKYEDTSANLGRMNMMLAHVRGGDTMPAAKE